MRVPFLTLIFLVLTQLNLFSQNQFGVMLNTSESFDGYTFFQDNGNAYLIDNCGNVINDWRVGNNSYHPKILENGNLMYLVRTGIIEQDWNGNIINQVNHNIANLELIYEVELLPNGNYLSVGRRGFTSSEFNEIGYDPFLGRPDEIDVVVELDRNTGEIVWEWNIGDHVIQQRDSTAANYGILSENPQLLNMDAISTFDWEFQESFMINGMDYNPELDQIILSVRKMSEIVVIDHSTTTEEAASHTGGRYGKGGDILYRWGNPQNYNRGTADDRILYFQHNPNWITEGELKGQIICYNNGLSRPGVTYGNNYSTVPIINPQIDENGNYVIEDGNPFLPSVAPLEYSREHTGSSFYSAYTSGAKYLANGNISVTEGYDGDLYEFDHEGNLVWHYKVPFVRYIFRSEKYSADYAGFAGRELVPQGKVPGDNSNYECDLTGTTSTSSIDQGLATFDVKFDWTQSDLRISHKFGNDFEMGLYDLQGKSFVQRKASSKLQLNLGDLHAGMYILHVSDQKSGAQLSRKIIIQ